jgi:hypothetical protein
MHSVCTLSDSSKSNLPFFALVVVDQTALHDYFLYRTQNTIAIKLR